MNYRKEKIKNLPISNFCLQFPFLVHQNHFTIVYTLSREGIWRFRRDCIPRELMIRLRQFCGANVRAGEYSYACVRSEINESLLPGGAAEYIPHPWEWLLFDVVMPDIYSA